MRRLSQLASCGAAIVFIALAIGASGAASAQDKGAGGAIPPAAYPMWSVSYATQIRARFAAQGLDVHGTSAEEFAAYLKAEVAKWSGVIQVAGLNAN